MARSLANTVLKGIIGSHHRAATCRTLCQQGTIAYYSVSSDAGTHDDFKSTSKLADSDISLKDVVEKDVKENPVMIYMKGIPEAPACGFSSLAVRVLKAHGVPIASRNILEDQELKSGVKAFSHWPTFPQIFINGEFIGGSDIILNMHQSGELTEKTQGRHNLPHCPKG
uniref:Monothiol glutaredoxin n=1 Tax=Zostera marina TaxID=29655 RepID=A0A0N7IZQ6_ZOSMR|nr:monothiol glutaredoxin [Zostera marina]